ncbi:MAG: hypothetical protein U0872_10695 [Planctomycetaceae bacterium]
MNTSVVRVVLIVMILIVAGVILVRPAVFVASGNVSAAAAESEDSWSLDDIKDVCEAAHFVMISLGIGCGILWFWTSWVPSHGGPRIEVSVEAERIGETETTRLVELVAWVKNIGQQSAKLSELQFTLRSILSGHTATGAALMKQVDLELLFETTPKQASFVVDAGAQRRCVLAVMVPKTVDFALVTARAKYGGRGVVYEASKVVRLL